MKEPARKSSTSRSSHNKENVISDTTHTTLDIVRINTEKTIRTVQISHFQLKI